MQRVQAVVDQCRSTAHSPRELAIALHDVVRDEVLFGFTPYFDAATPERTLQLGIGHCNPQASLMIALFRTAGFEARLRPATIGNDILRGTADTPARLSHLFTEVNLEGQWLRLDSYIDDPALRRSAIDRLRRDGRALGYGCHATATGKWDGRSNAFSQVATDSMIYELHDPVDDLETFFASPAYQHRVGPLRYNTLLMPTRLIAPIAMRAANLRIERMRVRDLATA